MFVNAIAEAMKTSSAGGPERIQAMKSNTIL